MRPEAREGAAASVFTASGECEWKQHSARVLLYPITYPSTRQYDLAPQLAAFAQTKRCTQVQLLQTFWNYVEVHVVV